MRVQYSQFEEYFFIHWGKACTKPSSIIPHLQISLHHSSCKVLPNNEPRLGIVHYGIYCTLWFISLFSSQTQKTWASGSENGVPLSIHWLISIFLHNLDRIPIVGYIPIICPSYARNHISHPCLYPLLPIILYNSWLYTTIFS